MAVYNIIPALNSAKWSYPEKGKLLELVCWKWTLTDLVGNTLITVSYSNYKKILTDFVKIWISAKLQIFSNVMQFED